MALRVIEFAIYDYLDYKNRLKRVQANGHIDFELFNSECVKVHRFPPSKICHQWHKWKSISIKNPESGQLSRPFNTYVFCDQHEKDAVPITVGFY